MSKIKRKCKAPGCDEDYYAKGYCQKHYNRVRKHGSTLTRQGKAPAQKGFGKRERTDWDKGRASTMHGGDLPDDIKDIYGF